jgi:hypothetical protein
LQQCHEKVGKYKSGAPIIVVSTKSDMANEVLKADNGIQCSAKADYYVPELFWDVIEECLHYCLQVNVLSYTALLKKLANGEAIIGNKKTCILQ